MCDEAAHANGKAHARERRIAPVAGARRGGSGTHATRLRIEGYGSWR